MNRQTMVTSIKELTNDPRLRSDHKALLESILACEGQVNPA